MRTWPTVEFLGAPVLNPFTDQSQLWPARADPWCILPWQIAPGSVTMSPLTGEKNTKFDHIFKFNILWWWLLAPETKLNAGGQLQTFPHPTISKAFLYSNVLMAMSLGQHLPSKAWWTNKKLASNFLAYTADCKVRALPYSAWWQKRSFIPKMFRANIFVSLLVGWLEFNIPCQHKYSYIRDERSGVESYPPTQWRNASDILTSTLADFLFSSHPIRERDRQGS